MRKPAEAALPTGRHFFTGLISLVLWLGSHLSASAEVTFRSAGGVTWNVHDFADQRGTRQKYFVSGSGKSGNLILLLQGSGCVPTFARMRDSNDVATSRQDSFARALHGQADLMIVEKPGVHASDPVGAFPGQSEHCGKDFRTRYALDDWGQVVEHALADYVRHAAVKPRMKALFGISEGTTTAAWMIKRGFKGPVGSMGGAGCDGDVVGMMAQAVQRQREGLPGTSIKDTLDLIEQIRLHPDSTDKFAWGQTYRRWSTFGDHCSTGQFERHRRLLFLAYGTNDPGADVISIEGLARSRRRASLPVEVVRIEGGNHGLSFGNRDFVPDVFSRFVAQILSRHEAGQRSQKRARR
ncbi:MAG TPA: hypothetical protein VK515_01940 [Rhizomicrobium sp.]|nr:hypothetical protein [Rhizomicrobium sp.]